ncbi:Kinesin-like protein kif15, partial [Porites harrisoni]
SCKSNKARKDKIYGTLFVVKNKPRLKEGGKNGYGLERRYHWIEAVISTKVTRLLSYQQDQLQLEKMAIESELGVAKVNMETAQEDAEYMAEELERTRMVEKQGFEEKEELKSKLESAMEEKFKMEKAIQKIEEENARLKGHQNPQQKVQHLLAIKRENHTLREQVNKLIKENLKCSCKGKKAPLATKNGGAENIKSEGGPRGSSSSEEGSSPTKATDTEKENVFTASS